MYMPWTGNLTAALQQNIRDMKQAVKDQGGLGTTRLFVFIARSTTEAHLYEIKYENNTLRNDTLQRYTFPETNYTTTEGLASILTRVKSASPTKKYSMIIGCHGSGWLPVGKVLKMPRRRAFGTASAADTQYQTEISTLAQAIEQTDTRMEYILFDDCYMAGIEIAYELRNVTQYVIASTCEMLDYGMPYHKCGSALLKHDYEGVCTEFINFYKSYHTPYGTLSVIDCEQTEPMAQLMAKINGEYAMDDSKTSSVQTLDGCDPTIFYDMGSYVEHLIGDASAPLYEEFTALAELLVPYSQHTDSYISYIHSKGGITYPINTYSGITISDITTSSEVVEAKTSTSWWKATH